jgi:cell division protease FtsH
MLCVSLFCFYGVIGVMGMIGFNRVRTPTTFLHSHLPFLKPSYSISRHYYQKYLEQLKTRNLSFPVLFIEEKENLTESKKEKYPISKNHYEQYLKRLNSRNASLQEEMILGREEEKQEEKMRGLFGEHWRVNRESGFGENRGEEGQEEGGQEKGEDNRRLQRYGSGDWFPTRNTENEDSSETKSKNFEVIKKYHLRFSDIGGYEKVKEELLQCVDILRNFTKYARFNVRIPRGLILEGPPGNGKTLLAKGLAGESGCAFISVSGADFQEKYVGVGSTRIKELFKLANKHTPCIIFIDEMDALGRKRSTDGESSSNERDNTLNALLVELDGFKNNTGIFVVGATNRVDLLDSALTRPGRMDKKIYIGLPDSYTREAILKIHLKGKPHDASIVLKDLVEITEGLSGSQIENLLNEAMLYALRMGHDMFTFKEFDLMMNKMMAGWQPVEHVFSSDIIDHIAIHEMGHAIVGILSKHHSKMSKVIINLSSPKMPGYTVFEGSTSNIYIREALFEHLMILLAGRIAEEAFYQESVSTGALNDFEEALKLAQKMVMYYGMGKNVIYPSLSEKYKEEIDKEVAFLINTAYEYAQEIIEIAKDLIYETAEILKEDKLLKADRLMQLIEEKYPEILEWKGT